MTSAAPLVVGFDLDMTLVDSRPGIAATLQALSEQTGVAMDVGAICAQLGPPLDQMLAPYADADDIGALVDRFRELYPERAVAATVLLPGAREALAAVRRHGGGSLVVTGKFTRNARLHLEALALDVDHLAGEVWGVGKAAALLDHGAGVYVGDHVHDVEGAHAAGALSVSVLTGGSTEAELREAGTDVVLAGLGDFPAWLDQHVLEQRLGRPRPRPARSRLRAGRLLRWSGQRSPARRSGTRARRRPRGRGHGVLRTRCRRPSATRRARSRSRSGCGCSPRAPTRWSGRATAPTPVTAATSARPSSLDVLGPLAAEHGLAHVATGTNADDGVAGFRPGHPCRGRAGCGHAAARRRSHQGAGAGRVPRAGGCRRGTSPPAACLSSRVAYGIDGRVPPGWPRERACGGRRPSALAAAGITSATSGSATSATGPASRSTRSVEAASTEPSVLAAVRYAPASTTPRSTRAASAPAR